MVNASEHVNAGFTDYSISLQPCEHITVVLGRVSSLSAEIFGDTSSFKAWTLAHGCTERDSCPLVLYLLNESGKPAHCEGEKHFGDQLPHLCKRMPLIEIEQIIPCET